MAGELLAVYGSLREAARAPDAPRPTGVTTVGSCIVVGRLYDLGPYPALVEDPAGRVVGDLLLVSGPAALAVLDAYEDCDPGDPLRSLYVRRRVRLHHPRVDAWVYVYNRPLDGVPAVEDGDWVAHLRTRGLSPRG